ncbi:MAG TPA: hypothetical protein VGC96_05095 [Candidatus Elarobacter sp.]|jgi:hypothetical protein
MSGQPRDAILVVGMGRSGSSALTRVLSLCGAALPLDVMEPNYGNPTGYWEPARAVQINESFLQQNGSSWYDADPRRQAIEAEEPEREEFVRQITDLLLHGFEPNGPLVVKDPRISILLPYWREAAARCGMPVKVVHVFRDPAEVAASLVRRDRVTTYYALSLWIKHNLIAERDGRDCPRVFVHYGDLLAGWERVITGCIARLGLELAVTGATRDAVGGFLIAPASATDAMPDLPPGPARRIAARTMALLLGARDDALDEDAFDALRAEQAGATVPLGIAV